MKISSLQSLNKNFQSYNSLSSMETIDSPCQIFEKSNSKKMPSRPLLNNIISKEDLRQYIVQDSFSSKNSLRRLDSYNFSENGQNIKSEHNIVIPVKARNLINNSDKFSHKKNQYSTAAPQEVYLDSSADEEQNHHQMAPQYHPSQYYSHYASQQAICSIDDAFENESESDEHNIWDNSEAEQMGINVNNSDVAFEFCQLYYIRSQLYQANKVNKNNVLEEVQVITNMCKKNMNMLRSNKLIDQVEKNHHLSLKKNALQVSKLRIQQARLATPIANLGSSASLKQTPKAFRISSYPLFSTPNKSSIKQSSQTNIHEDIVSPIYTSGRQLLTKSTTNFRLSSIETASIKRISPKIDGSNKQSPSTVKKVQLQLSSPQQRKTSNTGFQKYVAISKQNICNNLGKTMSHSKFYPNQEIKV